MQGASHQSKQTTLLEINPVNAEMTSRLLFTIAQYIFVVSCLCRRSDNHSAERAAMQELTMEATEEGV